MSRSGLVSREGIANHSRDHATQPLFLYLAMQTTHAPYEAPEDVLAKYSHISYKNRRPYAALIELCDQTVRNVTAALDDHDVVFGPAVDGGYYLLGVRRPVAVARAGGDAGVEGGGDAEAATGAGEGLESEKALVSPRLFRGVPWSTETVLRDSLVAARGAGLKAARESTLPLLRDVDVLEDVHAWVAKKGEAPNAAGNDDAFLAAAKALFTKSAS